MMPTGGYRPIGPGSGVASSAGRSVLTANANYYVATTGSDSNPGTLAQPWATLQHAYDYIAANLDIAGFFISVHIGAGTFAGFGAKGTVGGGTIVFFGAGSASTIITGGPNDGTFNFGECTSFNIASTGTVVAIHKCKIQPAATGFNVGVSIQSLGWYIWLTDPTDATSITDIVFDCVNGPTDLVDIEAPSILQDFFFNNGGSVTVNGAAKTMDEVFNLIAGAVFFHSAGWTFSGGLTVNLGTALVQDQAQIIQLLGTFSGTVTGPRFLIRGGGAIGNFLSSTISPTYLPGTVAGICDSTSAYGGIIGSNENYQTPINGFSITLGNTDTQVILNPAGALAAGTVTMAPLPIGGQVVTIRSSQAITALTISPNAGQNVVGAPTTIAAGGVISAIYNAANTTWYF